MTRKLFFLALALVFLPGYTEDEFQPWESGGRFFSDAPLIPVDQMTETCPLYKDSKGACVFNYPVLGESCKVVETRELGVFGESQYLLMRTLHSVQFDEGEQGTYTCEADEAALIEMPGKGQARLAWHSATEREYLFIRDAKLFSTPSGEAVLAVLYCLNGTGGCAQGPLIWSGGRWKKLARDESWQAVYDNLPEGYRRHKSPAIDFATMTWEEHLAGPDDPNCCPSGKIMFNLSSREHK